MGLKGWERGTLLVSGMLEFLLVAAAVADLGGKNLKDWFDPRGLDMARHWYDEGHAWAALGHVLDSVTVGGFTGDHLFGDPECCRGCTKFLGQF